MTPQFNRKEVVEYFYYNPMVEVKLEKRNYTKAVKKVEELESTSNIYFLGMRIITIKKTVKSL